VSYGRRAGHALATLEAATENAVIDFDTRADRNRQQRGAGWLLPRQSKPSYSPAARSLESNVRLTLALLAAAVLPDGGSTLSCAGLGRRGDHPQHTAPVIDGHAYQGASYFYTRDTVFRYGFDG